MMCLIRQRDNFTITFTHTHFLALQMAGVHLESRKMVEAVIPVVATSVPRGQ